MRALGAFIFAGGFTLGVSRVADVDLVLEETSYGVATAKANMPDIPIRVGKENWDLDGLKRHEWDLIYGNPPCAAWSQAGAKPNRDWRTDPRVNCTRVHFGLLEELRPRFWAWESVTQAFTNGRPLVDELTAKATTMGYSVTYLLHDAQHLGVPQVRKRFMFVAHKPVFDPKLPGFAAIACGDALRALNDSGEPLESEIAKFKDLVKQMIPGEDLRQTWERLTPKPWATNARGQVAGRPSFLTKRPRPNSPANVVMKEMVHPTEPRGLSIRELALLCGFPPMYEFEKPNPSLIAQGVCPPVAEWFAGEVKRCLINPDLTEPTVTVADLRKPPGTYRILSSPGERAPQTVKNEQAESVINEPTFETQLALTAKASVGGATGESPAATQKLRVGDVRPKPGVGSGVYMRLLISMGFATEEIVTMNKRHFPSSKATAKDVGWNKAKLARESSHEPTPIPHTLQTTRIRKVRDPEREFDHTSLTEKGYGYRVHRDYAAHFFRWGWSARQINKTMSVLEVGCGRDYPFVKTLVGAYANGVPASYLGVDHDRLPNPPVRPWAEFRGEFDFTERWGELGTFDRIVCLEVIEHMTAERGRALLVGTRGCLADRGRAFLSTPVFNGSAAGNHIHEYTIDELASRIAEAGLTVVERFGTFANQRDIEKVCTDAQKETLRGLNRYYSTNVTACFLAPLYPDASRNNMWILEKNR